ncbi:MAG: ABC transporter ATP-binding protein [Nitrososphaeria archaeon]
MLEIKELSSGYLGSKVLHNVTLSCEGGITLVAGPNGAGKSTLIKSINGSLRPVEGRISFSGRNIEKLNPHSISLLGIATVPERGRIFPSMTVIDNLRVSFESSNNKGSTFESSLENVYVLFPDLKEKANDRAITLSGGQQQMLSIGRAIIAGPKLLMLDEPTTGLFPKIVRDVISKILEISGTMPILLTEQNLTETLPISSKVYILESGRIVFSGSSAEMIEDHNLRELYFGMGGK